MKREDIPTYIVIEAARESEEKLYRTTVDCIKEKIDAPEKVIISAIEREVKKGLLDYGISLRNVWVTNL